MKFNVKEMIAGAGKSLLLFLATGALCHANVSDRNNGAAAMRMQSAAHFHHGPAQAAAPEETFSIKDPEEIC